MVAPLASSTSTSHTSRATCWKPIICSGTLGTMSRLCVKRHDSSMYRLNSWGVRVGNKVSVTRVRGSRGVGGTGEGVGGRDGVWVSGVERRGGCARSAYDSSVNKWNSRGVGYGSRVHQKVKQLWGPPKGCKAGGWTAGVG